MTISSSRSGTSRTTSTKQSSKKSVSLNKIVAVAGGGGICSVTSSCSSDQEDKRSSSRKNLDDYLHSLGGLGGGGGGGGKERRRSSGGGGGGRRRRDSKSNRNSIKINKKKNNDDYDDDDEQQALQEQRQQQQHHHHHHHNDDAETSMTSSASFHKHHDSDVRSLSEQNNTNTKLTLTEDSIRAFLVDYYTDYDACAVFGRSKECWGTFFDQNYSSNYNHIRPSGNPISTEGIIDMTTSGDLIIQRLRLVSVDVINIMAGGLAAVVTFTAEQWFSFKGKDNADRSVSTIVLEVVDGQPKIVHEHRSSGQPIPKETRWDV